MTTNMAGNSDSDWQMIKKEELQSYAPVFLGSKYFIIQTGNTMNAHEAIITRLKNCRPNLQEVSLVEECDFILLFCPVISRAGTDIEAAMKELQKHSDTKPAVLMVLHHTFDPECVLPGSSSAVDRINTIIHWRFHEDQGVLQCSKNDESFAVAIDHIPNPVPVEPWSGYLELIPQFIFRNNNISSLFGNLFNLLLNQAPAIQDKTKTPGHEDDMDNMMTGRHYHKYFTVPIGTPGDVCDLEETLNINGFRKVLYLDECDVILSLCTDVSHKTAVQVLNKLQGKKLGVVVVFRSESDPTGSTQYQTKKHIAVEWLYCKDQGVWRCEENDEVLRKILHFLDSKEISKKNEKGGADDMDNMMTDRRYHKYLTVPVGTPGDVCDVEQTLNINGFRKVLDLDECDVILSLCTDVSFKPAVKMLNKLLDNQLAVLMVLHSTSDFKANSFKKHPNIIAVDWLRNPNSTENDEPLSKILSWLESKECLLQKRTSNKRPINLKYYSVISGDTLYRDGSIERNFLKLLPGLQQVKNLSESDLVLSLCYAEKQDGTDIKEAVKTPQDLAGEKLGVVVVFRSESDPTGFAQYQTKKHIAVEWLYCKDQGFFQCEENDEALSKILNLLDSEEISKKNKKGGSNVSFGSVTNPPLHYYTLTSGPTFGIYSIIEKKLQEQYSGLKKVQNLEMSDVVLLFCPVVSRAGTYIEAAVRMLNANAGSKPAVLLVLHHTFDPCHIVPDSSIAVKREKTIAVDCLFHEDQGLLTCSQNLNALSGVEKWLRDWAD